MMFHLPALDKAFEGVRQVLRDILLVDEWHLKIIEDDFLMMVQCMRADQTWNAKEQERIRSLPSPVNSRRRGHKHEPRVKTKSVSDVRKSDEQRRRIARLLKVRMDEQAARARGVGAQGASGQDAAGGQGGQANQDPPTA
jgi:hypothetical protein